MDARSGSASLSRSHVSVRSVDAFCDHQPCSIAPAPMWKFVCTICIGPTLQPRVRKFDAPSNPRALLRKAPSEMDRKHRRPS
eukprot:4112971-Pleurochrysis_carterae.AAC.1